MNHCIECKFYNGVHIIATCNHPDNEKDLVDSNPLSCRMTRSPLYGICGPHGALFEPRYPIHPAIEIYKPKRWWHRLLFWRKP